MNALLLFGEVLKKNRQEKQISLTQVSASTRIHVRFLEAIEAGQFAVLPQPYIRPFLREYAVATELDPTETLQQYDAALQAEKPAPKPAEEKTEPASALTLTEKQQAKLASLLRRLSMPFAGLFVALVAVLFLANSGSTDSKTNQPAEVSFDRVVKESEAALVKAQPVIDRPASVKPRAVADSLRLEMTTTDSLWIVVVIDENRKEEYLFPPKSHRRWAAREQFTVTMGNAGNATFRLNGKELGSLGKPGAVVRNALITEATAPNL
jgi:cytoskeletal protein RodZ